MEHLSADTMSEATIDIVKFDFPVVLEPLTTNSPLNSLTYLNPNEQRLPSNGSAPLGSLSNSTVLQICNFATSFLHSLTWFTPSALRLCSDPRARYMVYSFSFYSRARSAEVTVQWRSL